MKALEKINEIRNGFNFEYHIPEEYKNVYLYLKDFPEKRSEFQPTLTDTDLINLYKDYIGFRHYGFSIGSPTPPQWIDYLVKVIEYLISIDPNFKINQIKMKFGGIRFYCYSDVIEDLHDIERYISEDLYDPKFIF